MNNDNTTTKPTIEIVLERVNELGEQLNNKLTELQTGQVQLQSEVAELRTGQVQLQSEVAELKSGQVEMRNDIADLRSGQRKIRFKFEALNDTLLSIQADLREDRHDFHMRLEKLESQQS